MGVATTVDVRPGERVPVGGGAAPTQAARVRVKFPNGAVQHYEGEKGAERLVRR